MPDSSLKSKLARSPRNCATPAGLAARLLGVALLSCFGCGYPNVVRVVDGFELRGRYISVAAYASFARGAELQARGYPHEALAAYRQAAERDAHSPEIFTRVGALSCQLGEAAAAEGAFTDAAEIDENYAPLWQARARCFEARGAPADALRASRHAVALEPEQVDSVLLLVQLLDRRGRPREAGRWLRALSLGHRDVERVWQAVEVHAKRVGDAAWQRTARRRVQQLHVRMRPPGRDRARSPRWREIDAALVRGQIGEARRVARRRRIDERWLSARALLVGRPALALAEASSRVAADPSDSDARLMAALSADLLGKSRRLTELMMALPAGARPPSPVGQVALAELMARHLDGVGGVDDRWPADAEGGAALADLMRRLRVRLRRSEDRE